MHTILVKFHEDRLNRLVVVYRRGDSWCILSRVRTPGAALNEAIDGPFVCTDKMFLLQQVTYYVIRTALLVSWFWAAVLTCAPVLGLGLYYDEARQTCARYRNATAPMDFGYAAFYVFFGKITHFSGNTQFPLNMSTVSLQSALWLDILSKVWSHQT